MKTMISIRNISLHYDAEKDMYRIISRESHGKKHRVLVTLNVLGIEIERIYQLYKENEQKIKIRSEKD